MHPNTVGYGTMSYYSLTSMAPCTGSALFGLEFIVRSTMASGSGVYLRDSYICMEEIHSPPLHMGLWNCIIVVYIAENLAFVLFVIIFPCIDFVCSCYINNNPVTAK